MTSIVLRKILATFLTCYRKALNVRGSKSQSHMPCQKSSTVVQTTSLWLPNKLLVTLASYNKITLHTVTIKPPVTIIDFDIWNSTFVLHNNVRFSAVCTHTVNRFYLTVYEVIKYNDVSSATNPYIFIENVCFADM